MRGYLTHSPTLVETNGWVGLGQAWGREMLSAELELAAWDLYGRMC